MIVKGDRNEIMDILENMNPLILEILPMTLEEAFTYKLESHGVNTFKEFSMEGIKDEK